MRSEVLLVYFYGRIRKRLVRFLQMAEGEDDYYNLDLQ